METLHKYQLLTAGFFCRCCCKPGDAAPGTSRELLSTGQRSVKQLWPSCFTNFLYVILGWVHFFYNQIFKKIVCSSKLKLSRGQRATILYNHHAAARVRSGVIAADGHAYIYYKCILICTSNHEVLVQHTFQTWLNEEIILTRFSNQARKKLTGGYKINCQPATK